MSDVQRLAAQAKALQEFEPFTVIAEEIRNSAVALFLNPASDINAISRAHEKIRAVETFTAAIKSRIDAEKVANKKAQDRGND